MRTSWPPGRSGWWAPLLGQQWQLQVPAAHWRNWLWHRLPSAAAGWGARMQPWEQERHASKNTSKCYPPKIISQWVMTLLPFYQIPSGHRPWDLCRQRWLECRVSARGSVSRSLTCWQLFWETHTVLPHQKSKTDREGLMEMAVSRKYMFSKQLSRHQTF